MKAVGAVSIAATVVPLLETTSSWPEWSHPSLFQLGFSVGTQFKVKTNLQPFLDCLQNTGYAAGGVADRKRHYNTRWKLDLNFLLVFYWYASSTTHCVGAVWDFVPAQNKRYAMWGARGRQKAETTSSFDRMNMMHLVNLRDWRSVDHMNNLWHGRSFSEYSSISSRKTTTSLTAYSIYVEKAALMRKKCFQ
jgi:hypothetical protein